MPAAFGTTIASFLRLAVDRAGCRWRTPGQALARVLLPTLGRRPRAGADRVGFVRLRGGCGSRAARGRHLWSGSSRVSRGSARLGPSR